MSIRTFSIFTLLVALSATAYGEDNAPKLAKGGAGVSSAPQSLADRAKLMKVNRKVFENFDPPQVLYEPEPSPSPAPRTSSANSGPSNASPSGALPQPRRPDPIGEYIAARKSAASFAACPKSTDAQKQAANERLEKAATAIKMPGHTPPK
jgi:hypothetical protein